MGFSGASWGTGSTIRCWTFDQAKESGRNRRRQNTSAVLPEYRVACRARTSSTARKSIVFSAEEGIRHCSRTASRSTWRTCASASASMVRGLAERHVMEKLKEHGSRVPIGNGPVLLERNRVEVHHGNGTTSSNAGANVIVSTGPRAAWSQSCLADAQRLRRSRI